jgi:hypothetical protein
MGTQNHEEISRNRYVKFVCGLGIVTFICLLFPVYMDLVTTHETMEMIHQRFSPSKMSRLAVLSAAMPLLFDCLYDLSLPQRLIFPRFSILVSLIVPNACQILIEHLYYKKSTAEMSFAFDFASYPLFYCGLLAYMVGEIQSKPLRNLVTFTAVGKCVEFTFVTFHVYTHFGSWTSVMISSLVSHILFTLLLVWIVKHMQGLDARSRTFASLYAAAIIFTWWLSTAAFIFLPSFNGDASQLILVLVAVLLTTIASRMGQYDAVVAMVSFQ